MFSDNFETINRLERVAGRLRGFRDSDIHSGIWLRFTTHSRVSRNFGLQRFRLSKHFNAALFVNVTWQMN